LYQGSFLSVGTKEEIQTSRHPRIRQFLDRIPEDMAKTPAVAAHFQKYLEARETLQ